MKQLQPNSYNTPNTDRYNILNNKQQIFLGIIFAYSLLQFTNNTTFREQT